MCVLQVELSGCKVKADFILTAASKATSKKVRQRWFLPSIPPLIPLRLVIALLSAAHPLGAGHLDQGAALPAARRQLGQTSPD